MTQVEKFRETMRGDVLISWARDAQCELEQLREQVDTLTHQVICCGVAASHPDPNLTKRGEYAGKWDSSQAEEVRKLRAENERLKFREKNCATENQGMLVCDGEKIDFAMTQKQIPRWDAVGMPENIYAAAADAYKWLVLMQYGGGKLGLSGKDFENLDACMVALSSFLPDGHEKMRIG